MFWGQRAANAPGMFRLRWGGESSLTTGLLGDVPPEIELSDYGRLPASPRSECPLGLLIGESLNVEAIADLDLFFERLYSYYCEKGLWCIIIKWIVELLSVGFTICFSGFFLLFVDWNGLHNAKCGMDAVESGTKPCDLAKEALHEHPLTPLTLSKAIVAGYLVLFSVYWVFCFLRFFAQLKDTLGIQHFFYNSLHITDSEIQTMPWAAILEKVVRLQSSSQLCVVKDLSTHDVVMRLVRKENYFIGMLNKGVLAFPISPWVPGAGPTVKFGSGGTRHRLILTKNFCVRRDFITNPRTLKKRLIIVGLTMLLLSPFLVIFMLVYLFLRHAEQFYNHPSTASSRRWSNLSKWMFREFNEVEHLFRHRINSSVMHASEYLKQFPSPVISIIAKFISFVSGGFAAVLIIIAFVEESLLEGHVIFSSFHPFEFFYFLFPIFGTITAISRAAVADELLVLDPRGAMSMVVQHTHYMVKRWRGKENIETVRIEFETLYQYTGMILLEEMASIFLTPLLLLFVVPKQVDDILQFIADFTIDVEGVGHVCSFSAFDFQNHGNSKYGSPHNVPRAQRSSQGKMEKSFLSFQSSYPLWEPDAQGKQFLSNIRIFGEQKLQGQGTGHTYSLDRLWRGSPPRAYRDRNGLSSREMQNNIPGSGNDSSHRRHTTTRQFEPAEQQHGDYWGPTSLAHNEGIDEDHWLHHYDNRSQSQLEASTSAPFFHDSVLQHHDANHLAHHTWSHWWDRSGLHGSQPQASFLEPPDFNRYPADCQYDNLSGRSIQGQDQYLDWRDSRRLSHMSYMDDLEAGGDINLHFDGIYTTSSESPTVNLRPPGFH
ncbi:hypothetical protein CXB51_020372 [Gossypium anomalum]|uniref:Autophagy-related protein 9 n=1 Tax=Gossypium anomalum TaxID=47600 RepID=A0A8J6D0K4_9ROSI|nr:hypothetical protein CXB51_020372 [Gossypium anomalum]